MSTSLLDHWINQDIASLEFLDGLCTGSSVRTSDSCSNCELSPVPVNSKHEALPNFGGVDCEKPLVKDNYQVSTGLPHWGFLMNVDSLKLDDVFQVDESDLVHSPTLAALNGDKEPLFELEFDDLDFDFPLIASNVQIDLPARSEVSNDRPSTPPVKLDKMGDTVYVKREQLEVEPIAAKERNECSESQCKLGTSLPLTVPDGSVRSRRRTTSTTDFSVTSSVSSNDEGFSSQAEDTDVELQIESDSESVACDEESLEDSSLSQSGSVQSRPVNATSPVYSRGTRLSVRRKRYFWQYNVQSKGPKGPRLAVGSTRLSDPHVLNDVSDPVFSNECHLDGVKHAVMDF